MNLCQVHINGGPGIQNGPAAGGLAFKTEIYLNIFFSRTPPFRCLKLDMYHCLVFLYIVCSNQGLRVQDGPSPGVLGLNHRNT